MPNNDAVQEMINGIGLMTELWIIVYDSFTSHGMNDREAFAHTREFMSVITGYILNTGNTGKTEDGK